MPLVATEAAFVQRDTRNSAFQDVLPLKQVLRIAQIAPRIA